MKNLAGAVAFAVLTAGCSSPQATLEIPAGSDVTVQKKDGGKIAGKLVETQPDRVILQAADGTKTEVRRGDIASVSGAPAAPSAVPESPGMPADPPAGKRESAASVERPADPVPEYREVTLPAGTVLPLELQTAVGSDSSKVEDPVRATLRRTITVEGVKALPAGSVVLGHVTAADRAGRVKGRARVAFRFTKIDPAGDAERLTVSTTTVSRMAEATKKQDAAKIGGGAVGGAIIGGILGGGDGAAKGAAVGGAAGTGVVLATRGKDVRLGPGADISVKLTAPVTVRVLVQK
jgi:hypothetical protein